MRREIQYEDRNDKQIVLAAVRQKGLAIQYAHPDLMSDKDVVMAAVKEDGYVYEYANDLSADKDFFINHIIEELKPTDMIEAFYVFSQNAKESDINDVSNNIVKRCQTNKDYLMTLLNHLNSTNCPKIVKNILGKISGPNIIDMILKK